MSNTITGDEPIHQLERQCKIIEQFYISHGGKPNMEADLCFYTSDWNMLMPVVEKIESIGNYAVTISAYSCSISEIVLFDEDSHVHIESDCDSKIDAVYKAVIEFIQWYNNQLNKQP